MNSNSDSGCTMSYTYIKYFNNIYIFIYYIYYTPIIYGVKE